MRPTSLFLVLAITLGLSIALIGCGGNASPASTTTTPTPPATTPPATPPGSGSGSSTSGIQLQESIQGPSGSGTLTVNSSGDVSIQVSGMAPGANFTWNFCAVPAVSPCLDLGQKLLTDNGGNGQLTFRFPKSGTWSGYFVGNSAPPGTRGAYGITTYDSALHSVSADMQKMSGINGSAIDSTPQDPLTSGHVTVANGTATINVAGAAPMVMYDVILQGSGGSSSYGEGKLSTDANGNGNAQLKLSGDPGSVFRFTRTGANGFVTGFRVP